MFVSNNCTFYSFKGTLPDNVNSISVPPIINGTSDYKIANILNEAIIERLNNENILKIVDLELADSKLDILIESINNIPNVYEYQDGSYEKVKQWKLETVVKLSWYNLNENKIISEKIIKEWAMYNNTGQDISSDGIDNDNDGFIDGEDSDEFGPPREGAINIISNKITESIINVLISNW